MPAAGDDIALKNRWFPSDRSLPRMKSALSEGPLESLPVTVTEMRLTFDTTCNLYVSTSNEDGSYSVLTFEDVDDLVLDGRLSVGISPTGLEVFDLSRLIGKRDSRSDGRVVYVLDFVETVLTFASQPVATSPGPSGD